MHADADRPGRLVARTGDLRGLAHRRQPLPRDLQRREHLLAPAPVRDVEEEGSRRVGGIGRLLAEEPEADVILREQDVGDSPVDVRLVPAQPEELRRREAGQRAVARQLDQPFEADPLLDLGALGGRPLVVPEDRRAQDAPFGVERHEPVHLAREPDPLSARAQPLQRLLGGAHPVVGILLGPSGARNRELVALLRPSDDLAVRRQSDRLDP